MKFQIEQIIIYLQEHHHKYSFIIREYSTFYGSYYNEAVVLDLVGSEYIGLIVEIDPINPATYYTKQEMLAILDRLEEKTQRLLKTIHTADRLFKYATKTTS